MKKILVQHSQSTLYHKFLEIIDNRFDPVIAPDQLLGEVMSQNKNDILAIVIFELTESSLKVSKLARNERFFDPTIPIAYIGYESTTSPMPYGAVRFEERELETLPEFLEIQIEIKALVVEDDEALREITSLTLSKHMTVDSAADGDEAYKAVNESIYDVVILDVMLPGMSGEEIFGILRDNSPDTAVIIVTAFDTDEREFNFTFNGAAAYIKKPFESNKIFRQQVMDATITHYEEMQLVKIAEARLNRDVALQNYRRMMSRYT